MQSDPAPNWQKIANVEILSRLATQAALSSDWEQAIKINEKILGIQSDHVESLNRLARAHLCLGEIEKAKKTYKKVLTVDPYNVIATKNYEKLEKSNGTQSPAKPKNIISDFANLFISEPGKTKVISLLNLAQPSVLANISYGELLVINAKSHSITISTTEGTYLGALPDDLAHRIIAFISGGNKYEVYVKAISPKMLTVFIKETERSERFTNQPSFQNTSQQFAYTE